MSILRKQLFFAIVSPILLVITAAFISNKFAMEKLLEKEQDLALSIYEDQLMFEKQKNIASVLQIYYKVQQIPWQQFIMAQLLYKMLTEQVIMNKHFVPLIMNSERTFFNQESKVLTDIALKNKLHVSSWYSPDSETIDGLTLGNKINLNLAAALDLFSRPVRYLSTLQTDPESQIKQEIDLFKFILVFDSDGCVLSSFGNTTVTVFENEIDCPTHRNIFDFRCRIWYQHVISTPVSFIFPPEFTIGETNKEFFVASVICKKQIDFLQLFSNPNATLFVHCIELQLQNLKSFFSGYTNDYSRQIVIDPRTLRIVFDTNSTFNTLEIFTLEQQFLGSLTKETSEKITKFLSDYFGSYVMRKGNSFNILSSKQDSQFSIEFENSKGEQYYLIANSISFFDKIQIPALQNQSSQTISYQIQVFTLLDILSREKLMEVTNTLQNEIFQVTLITQIILSGIFAIVVIFVFILSTNISSNIEVPINKLIRIFKQMNLDPDSAEEIAQLSSNTDKTLNSISIIKELFQSQDALILYETFSNLVKLLNFTAQDIFKGNPSQILLNLNEQILFFSRFKNESSLGICHNNIANIHYFQGRHVQALSHYEQAIIQSQILLGQYNEDSEDKKKVFFNFNKLNENVRDISLTTEISKILKDSKQNFQQAFIHPFQEEDEVEEVQNKISYDDIPFGSQNLHSQEFIDSNNSRKQQIVNTDQEFQSGQQKILLENLFNRKFNYFKCLFEYYLFSANEVVCPFLIDFLNLCKELVIINSLLDHSLGRLIILINFLTQIQISLNLENESLESFNTLKQLLSLKKKEEEQYFQNQRRQQMNKFDPSKPLLINYDSPYSQETKRNSIQSPSKKSNQKKTTFQKKISDVSLQEKNSPLKQPKLSEISLIEKNTPLKIKTQKSYGSEIHSPPMKKFFSILSPYLNQNQNKKILPDDLIVNKKKNISFFDKISNPQSKDLISKPESNKYSVESIFLKGCYEFPSDALSSYLAILQSSYLERKKQYYSAALILTENIENQFYFFQSARDLIFRKIQNILNKFDIQDLNVKKEINILNCQQVYKLSFISLCVESKNKSQSIQFSCKILDDILKRDDDQFGLIAFDFEEMKNCSLIAMTNCKMIKTNKTQIFSQIETSFLKGKADLDKEAKGQIDPHKDLEGTLEIADFDLFPNLTKLDSTNKKNIIEQKMTLEFIEDKPKEKKQRTPLFIQTNYSQKQDSKNFFDPPGSIKSKNTITKEKYTQIFHHCVRYSILSCFFGGKLTRELMTKKIIQSQKEETIKKQKNIVKNLIIKNRNTEKPKTLIQAQAQPIHSQKGKILKFGFEKSKTQTGILNQSEKKINHSDELNNIDNSEKDKILISKNNKISNKIVIKKYLVLYLDSEYLVNLNILKLGKCLNDHDIKMLVLILSPNFLSEGNSQFQDFLFEDNEVIQYFFSEEKLIQYLNNQRQHNKYKHIIQIIERF